MTKVLVDIGACKNILDGKLEIHTEQINIKYAQNGTGKSTIGEALLNHVNGTLATTVSLQSFLTEEPPFVTVSIEDEKGNIEKKDDFFKHVEIFDEEFVNNIVFKENQAITDSFNVFIKTTDYEERKEALENKLTDLRGLLSTDASISELLAALQLVSSKFSINNSGAIALKGIYKDVLNPTNVYQLPSELNKYKPFLWNESRVSWISWKSQGYQYAKEPFCPFCASSLPSEEIQKDQEVFDSTYNKTVVKNQKELEDFITTLNPYLDEQYYSVLLGYTRKIDNIDDFKHEFQRFINEINLLLSRITGLTAFSTYGINNTDLAKLEEKLNSYRINESTYLYFHNPKTIDIFSRINSRIDSAIQKIGEIKASTILLNKLVRGYISESSTDINDFLSLAGINYQFILNSDTDNSCFAKLIYIGAQSDIADKANLRKCLSWGERNAISLVLFIYFVNSKKADLVILDDPISSFDKSKKFAIIKRLFKAPSEAKSLLKQTVLFLSHDFEPIIDLYYEQRFQQRFANVAYLINNAGKLREQMVNPATDIQPITVLYIRDMRNKNLNLIFRLVALRKHLEYVDEFCADNFAYHYVSSLFKCRETPMIKKGKNDPGIEMSPEQIEHAVTSLSIMMGLSKDDISYDNWRAEYFAETTLIQSLRNETRSFYRIQLLRCLITMERQVVQINDVVLVKYLNSCFHIENDYSHYLDYTIFDPVPPFITVRLEKALLEVL